MRTRPLAFAALLAVGMPVSASAQADSPYLPTPAPPESAPGSLPPLPEVPPDPPRGPRAPRGAHDPIANPDALAREVIERAKQELQRLTEQRQRDLRDIAQIQARVQAAEHAMVKWQRIMKAIEQASAAPAEPTPASPFEPAPTVLRRPRPELLPRPSNLDDEPPLRFPPTRVEGQRPEVPSPGEPDSPAPPPAEERGTEPVELPNP